MCRRARRCAGRPCPRRAARDLTIRPPLRRPSFAKPRVRSSSRSGWGTRSNVDLDPVEEAGREVVADEAPVRVLLLDGMAELGEERGGVLDALGDLVSELRGRGQARRLGRPGDAKPPGRCVRGLVTKEWSGGGGPPGTPPWQTSSQSAESSTVRVTAARDGEPVPVLARGRERDPVALRLHAEEAAKRGRDADRAAAVRRGCGGAEAGGGRGRGASARPAGRARGVPWVAGDSPRLGLGEAADRELGKVRLAENDRPRGSQAADHLAVRLRRARRSPACPRS